MEQHVLDTSVGKQLSKAATDAELSLALTKWTTFKYRSEFWPSDVSKQEEVLGFQQFLKYAVTLKLAYLISLLIFIVVTKLSFFNVLPKTLHY